MRENSATPGHIVDSDYHLSGLLGAQERLAAMKDSATEYEILSIETKKRCNAKGRRQGPRRNLW